jgi:hypothetical protein
VALPSPSPYAIITSLRAPYHYKIIPVAKNNGDIFLVLQEHRLSPIVLEREVLGEVDRWINTYFFH